MRKKTILLLALFVALLAVVQFAGRGTDAEVLPPLKLKGWAVERPAVHPHSTPVNIARAPNQEPPYHRIEIEKAGQKIVMIRDADDATIWDIIEPIRAPGEVHRVRSMFNIVREDLESVTSFRLRKGNKSRFGLSGSEAIHLRLIAKDESQSLELVLGKQDRDRITEDGPGTIRTWIHAPKIQPKAVYLIEGMDLRQPFKLELSKYRSKRLFTIRKWTDIDGVKIHNPSALESKTIEIARSEDCDDAMESEEWVFLKPMDLALGSPKSLFSSIRSLVADKIVSKSGLPADAGLDDPKIYATMDVAVGEAKLSMRIGPLVNDSFWIQIASRPDEYYQLPGAKRLSILPEASALREKDVLGIKDSDDLVSIRTLVGGRTHFSMKREEGVWRRSDGAALDASRTNLLMNTLAKMKVRSFTKGVGPDEAGLATPSLQVEYTMSDKTRVLSFGKEVDGKVYARVGDSDEIFSVIPYTVKQLGKGWAELRSRALVDQAADQVQTVSVQLSSGSSHEIFLEDGEDGTRVWSLKPLLKEQELELTKIKALVRSSVSLQVKRFLDKNDEKVTGLGKGTPVSTVTISFKQGADIVLRISNLSDLDARYVQVQGGPMSGKTVTVRSANLDTVLQETKELVKTP